MDLDETTGQVQGPAVDFTLYRYRVRNIALNPLFPIKMVINC